MRQARTSGLATSGIRSLSRLLYSRREAAHQLSISARSIDYLIETREINVRRNGKRILVPTLSLSGTPAPITINPYVLNLSGKTPQRPRKLRRLRTLFPVVLDFPVWSSAEEEKARWTGTEALFVGRRPHPRGRASLQHMAGPVPCGGHRRRRFCWKLPG
jgi:hypothetical protein